MYDHTLYCEIFSPCVMLLMAILCCYCIMYLSSLWSVVWENNVFYVSECTLRRLTLSEEKTV
jgi:hypothetical protein